MTNAGVTWRYYYQDNSVYLAQWADWNDPQIQGNVRNIQEWYDILASPSADQDLPQVVFIERASATGYDEHPGNNVQKGAARVQQIMSALMTSNAWPDSVFILGFDEGGGTYDHQAPILATVSLIGCLRATSTWLRATNAAIPEHLRISPRPPEAAARRGRRASWRRSRGASAGSAC